MTCAEFDVLLSDYVDGHVTIEQRRVIESHADECESCRELLRDVFQAVGFLEAAEKATPPPELITRIVHHAPRGRLRDESERRGSLSRLFTNWLQPVLQPRFQMSIAMTILSFAMLGRCTGIRVQEIKPADLNPVVLWNNLEDKAFRTWDRTVKYYENLRLVYEVETRLKEIREDQDAASGAKTSPANEAKPAGRRGNQGGTQR